MPDERIFNLQYTFSSILSFSFSPPSLSHPPLFQTLFSPTHFHSVSCPFFLHGIFIYLLLFFPLYIYVSIYFFLYFPSFPVHLNPYIFISLYHFISITFFHPFPYSISFNIFLSFPLYLFSLSPYL